MTPRLYVLHPWAIHLGRTEAGHEARDPTGADLLAHLAQTPAAALQIAEQLRVARAWVEVRGAWFRFDGRETLDNEDAASLKGQHVTPVGHVWRSDGAWHGAVYGSSLGETWALDGVARDAVDQALSDLGTILVSR